MEQILRLTQSLKGFASLNKIPKRTIDSGASRHLGRLNNRPKCLPSADVKIRFNGLNSLNRKSRKSNIESFC